MYIILKKIYYFYKSKIIYQKKEAVSFVLIQRIIIINHQRNNMTFYRYRFKNITNNMFIFENAEAKNEQIQAYWFTL